MKTISEMKQIYKKNIQQQLNKKLDKILSILESLEMIEDETLESEPVEEKAE